MSVEQKTCSLNNSVKLALAESNYCNDDYFGDLLFDD